MPAKGFFNVKDTAAFLDISENAVRALVRRGRLFSTKIKGRYVIESDSIKRYMCSHSYEIGQARRKRILNERTGNNV
jgi:hypothetical protein